jgi:hypothetical protein
MQLSFDGVAENDIVVEHEGETCYDDNGAGPGEFFVHKLVLLWIPGATANVRHEDLSRE